MSQNLTAILKQGAPDDEGIIDFIISGNSLSISNGSAIQLTGVNSTLGTGASRFQVAFSDGTTYYVKDLSSQGPSNFKFNLTANFGPTEPAITVAVAPGATSFTITNPGAVSFSLAGGICFLGNTLVNTDQGKVKFNELTTKNTINKHQINKVVSVMNKDNTMVLVKKDSLGDSVPNKDTYISNNHKILIDGNYFEAKNIVNNFNIYTKNMPRKRLYNVLLDHHGTMIVNNMVVETLDPNNKFAH
jgi:hypothetical protein